MVNGEKLAEIDSALLEVGIRLCMQLSCRFDSEKSKSLSELNAKYRRVHRGGPRIGTVLPSSEEFARPKR